MQLAYQIVSAGRLELSAAPDEYAGFVMTLLRLHTFRPSTVADFLSSVSSPDRQARVASKLSGTNIDEVPVKEPPSFKAVSFPMSQPNDEDADWNSIVASLQLTGLAKTLAQHCELRYINERECLLSFRRLMCICK